MQRKFQRNRDKAPNRKKGGKIEAKKQYQSCASKRDIRRFGQSWCQRENHGGCVSLGQDTRELAEEGHKDGPHARRHKTTKVFLASRDNCHTAAEVDGRSRDDGDQEHGYCDTVDDEGNGPVKRKENVRIWDNQAAPGDFAFVLGPSPYERVEGKGWSSPPVSCLFGE
jgi:hypothetical protein